MSEKRHFSRLSFDAEVCVEFLHQDEVLTSELELALSEPNRLIPLKMGKSIQVCGEILDISIKGALVSPKIKLPIENGKECVLEIRFGNSDLTLVFDVMLIHNSENGLGLKFVRIDPEAMMHLRRFLEFNLGSDELVERELSHLADE